MTNPNTPLERALAHLDAVQAHADNLRDEWRSPRPDSGNVKYLTASIGRGLKLAEVNALLNIGAQLDRLATRLEDDDLLDFRGADVAQMDRLLTRETRR